MKTIVLEQPGTFTLTETESPEQPGPDEALVRVHRVGICGTDLHAFRGRQPFFSYPRILGHELGVEVVVLGQTNLDHTIEVGDYCSIEPYLNCGQCPACRRGKTNCCRTLQTLGVHTDGGMREYITIPLNKLHKAQGASLEQLAIVEMLCIGAHAVRRANLAPDEPTLVIGTGPIGLGAAQFAKLAGANVIVMDINPQRLEFCQRNLGIEAGINASQEPLKQLQDALSGDLPMTVFDATGNVGSMKQAFNYVENGGQLVLVGLVQDDISFHDPEFHRREMTVLSSRNATGEDFAWVIKNLDEGNVNLDPWITHQATPEALVDEFPSWLEPETGVIKAMLSFE